MTSRPRRWRRPGAPASPCLQEGGLCPSGVWWDGILIALGRDSSEPRSCTNLQSLSLPRPQFPSLESESWRFPPLGAQNCLPAEGVSQPQSEGRLQGYLLSSPDQCLTGPFYCLPTGARWPVSP